MPKKKLPKKNPEEKVKKQRNLKRNRARGNAYECAIAQELRDLRYPNIKTSRSESKAMDDRKVDLVDLDNKLEFYPQIKATMNTPDYFGIEKQCPLKDKPFIIFWKKIKATESTFRSEGEIVMLPKSFFYELLKTYKNE
jgi:hypothetical protein